MQQPIDENSEGLPLFRGRMPLSPSINGSYCIIIVPGRNGKMVRTIGPTPELKQFKKDAALSLRDTKTSHCDAALLSMVKGFSKSKVGLRVSLVFYFETQWKRDVDGCIKASTDATFEYLDLNDNLVLEVTARKTVNRADPHCEVEVFVVDVL